MSYHDYEAVIGLEIHVQLKTESKMFCACSTQFGEGDNENTCPVCTGQPGALPAVNMKAVEYAAKMARALRAKVDLESVFARKNYFYPDMVKGYQISQYERPIVYEGSFEFIHQGDVRTVEIERAHLEEDAGKSSHEGTYSLINYNRASTPLLEIVTAPDLRSPGEAADYARAIRRAVRYLEICDGNMEEGSLRCDCNVSIRKKGDTRLGTKVEIKNLNSFRFVEKALQFEIERQIDVVEGQGEVVQETRLYDIDKNKTFTMRLKEEAADYRYFPEPDLLRLKLSEEQVQRWQASSPELPMDRRRRYLEELNLTAKDADLMIEEKSLADYFEKVFAVSGEAKLSANWVAGDVLAALNENSLDIEDSRVEAEKLGEIISHIKTGALSGTMAKRVFTEVWKSGESVSEVIERLGLKQVSDSGEIEAWVDEVLANSEAQVAEYRSGKTKVFGFFVGQVMKVSRGKANPELVNQLLRAKLDA